MVEKGISVGMGFMESKDRINSKDEVSYLSLKSETLGQIAKKNHRARYRAARKEVFLRAKMGYSNNWNPFML